MPNQKIGIHPTHPKCPECKKAMYKSMVKGQAVKKKDPWAYCRNKACSLYGQNQAELEARVESDAESSTEPVVSVSKKPVSPKSLKIDFNKEITDVDKDDGEKKIKLKKDTAKKKLTKKAKAKRVRKDLESGKYTVEEIAKRNKCTPAAVSKIQKKLEQRGVA